MQSMKQHATFSRLLNNILLIALLFIGVAFVSTPVVVHAVPSGECNDQRDNDGDGKIDYYGLDSNGDGTIDVEPDPACYSQDSTSEHIDGKNDDVQSSIIPCTDKCSFSDVFKLANNLLVFIIKVLLIPVFIMVIIYTGYQYLISQGSPVKMANIKNTLKHLVFGILLILCAWLIVVTGLKAIGYTDHILFFETLK